MVAHDHEIKFGQGWVDLSLGLVILLTIVGAAVASPRTDKIVEAARGGSGPVPPDLAAQVNHPVLRLSTLVPTWLAIGILFLMARQPGWAGSWLTVVVAGLIGLAEAVLVGRFAVGAGTTNTTADTTPMT
jgi:uncharacterized membrane protein